MNSLSDSPYKLADLGWSHFFQQQLSLEELDSCIPARVFALHGQIIDIISQYGREQVTFPGNWKHEDPENLPTVGDWVLVDADSRQPLRLLERKSLFKRMASGRDAKIQLLSANVDTLFIVTSFNQDFNLSRLERYLALALDSGVEPVLVLTKIDLADEIELFMEQATTLRPGLVVETVNSRDAQSVDKLRIWCGPGQTVALVGSSGVGKSTIINSLCGEERQATGEIRDADAKGRHTTTARSLHFLPDGGLLLDSPGMRELQLSDCEGGIASVFDEVEAIARQCQFRDCRHAGEKGCAIEKALDADELDPRRVENYLKLLAEQERMNETLVEKRRKDKVFGKMVKSALSEKKTGRDDY